MSETGINPRPFLFAAIFLIAPFAVAQTAKASTTPSFMGLGGITGGNSHNQAFGVSGDGSTVVGWSGNNAFRWTTNGGMQSLGSGTSVAFAVSYDGSIIAGRRGGLQAFRWTQQTGMVNLGQLPGGTNVYNSAHGISGDGTVIVGTGSLASPDYDPFRWTQNSGMVSLGDVPGGRPGASVAHAASSDGSTIVGYAWSSINQEAFRWTQATGMSLLSGQPQGFLATNAAAVSSDGSVVVGAGIDLSIPGLIEAYRWTENGGLQRLGDLPEGDFESTAWGVSGNGQIVVGDGITGQYGNDWEAFIWDPGHGMRNLRDVLVNDFGLNLTGWTLNSAQAISSDGTTIVGYGTNPSGNQEAWRAVIPEPTAVSLMMCSLMTIGLARRRPLVIR